MERKELRAKIVEMLNCDELHELEKKHYWATKDVMIQALEKYEQVITFILNQLNKWNTD